MVWLDKLEDGLVIVQGTLDAKKLQELLVAERPPTGAVLTVDTGQMTATLTPNRYGEPPLEIELEVLSED